MALKPLNQSSYPFRVIAETFGIPYWVALCYRENFHADYWALQANEYLVDRLTIEKHVAFKAAVEFANTKHRIAASGTAPDDDASIDAMVEQLRAVAEKHSRESGVSLQNKSSFRIPVDGFVEWHAAELLIKLKISRQQLLHIINRETGGGAAAEKEIKSK